MERQLQNAAIQNDDSNHPGLTHIEEGEEPITETAAQIIIDSPPSTISFDEDPTQRQPHSEQSSPVEDVGDPYTSGLPTGRKRKRDIVDGLSSKSDREFCESLFLRIDELKKENRELKEENRRFEQCLDKQKARKSLECPICLGEKEKWLYVQCGHLICYDCILDRLKREALFNRSCPLCQVPVISLAKCYPSLR